MNEDILKGLRHKLLEEKETLESDLAKFAEKDKRRVILRLNFPIMAEAKRTMNLKLLPTPH